MSILKQFQKTHGAPASPERHVGDFGNINVDHGKASIDYTDKVASLFGRPEMSVSLFNTERGKMFGFVYVTSTGEHLGFVLH